ncbi:MAG: VTT domain-containing protein [Microthrixaceae bacterium]
MHGSRTGSPLPSARSAFAPSSSATAHGSVSARPTSTGPRRGSTADRAPRCSCADAYPLIRSLISIPAGFRRMPLGAFTLFTLIGSLVWNTVLVTAGYLLADQWEKVLEFTEPFQTLVVVAHRSHSSWRSSSARWS